MTELMPAAPLLIGALLLPILPRRLRPVLFVLAPALGFGLLTQLSASAVLTWPLLNYELLISRVDRLSLAFGYVFTLAAFLGAIYGFHLRDLGQQVAALLYAGAGLGVVFAGDWLTLYVFWEIMAMASVWLILSARTGLSMRAALRYLLMHLFGGAVLLAGILWHIQDTSSLSFEPLPVSGAGWLILLGFAVNAAIPPLHAWIADSYPEATPTGSVFLSAFTTKAAVYVLARAFPGAELLLIAGTAMALYGVIFAVIENDIRRILSYHIVSQVGYMIAGIGLGTETALNGATAHAFAHILYKGLLFMATGAVIQATGRRRLSELGGLNGPLRWVLVFYMFGALSISGLPLLSGFVSKSLVIHAAELEHRGWVVLLLSVASVGTFGSIGLKLPYFTWFGSRRPIKTDAIPCGMYLAMALASAINLTLGLWPGLLYGVMPFNVTYQPYTAAHLLESVELLGFTALAVWFFRAQMTAKTALTLDVDWFYRHPAPSLRRWFVDAVNDLFAGAESMVLICVDQVTKLAANPMALRTRLHSYFRPEIAAQMGGSDRRYDPDRYRPPIALALLITLASFVLLLGWYLISEIRRG
ncbi:MAG: Na(+)/H(+) antiporter subunit D [Candidatus Binatia bacterium]